MPAALYPLVFEQGATFQVTFRLKQPDGTPLPLPGFSSRMQVRPDYGSATVLLDLTEGAGIVTDQTAGTISVSVDAATAQGLPLPPAISRVQVNGRWVLPLGVYDIKISNGAGYVERLFEEQVYLDPGVTL
jgi:hypothetical protein